MSDASAPGKLVIAGEYAVLHGAPAVVMALDVRAQATVSRVAKTDSVLVDSVSGQEFRFHCHEQKGFQWLGRAPGERGRILLVVLSTFLEVQQDFASGSDYVPGRTAGFWVRSCTQGQHENRCVLQARRGGAPEAWSGLQRGRTRRTSWRLIRCLILSARHPALQ